MPPNLTHVALHVPDVDACRRFYADYCGMRVVHERGPAGERTLWMAEPGRERSFVLVIISGGQRREQSPADFGHLGFALASRAEVDARAERARAAGCLVWPPRQHPPPVGYFCGVRAPSGRIVEFSYGQPLGPEAAEEPPGA